MQSHRGLSRLAGKRPSRHNGHLMRKNFFGTTAILAATLPLLSGCSYFSCCYTEISNEEFGERIGSRIAGTVQLPIELRGYDADFGYYEASRFFWFAELIKVKETQTEAGWMRYGKFPWVSGVYINYNRAFEESGLDELLTAPVKETKGPLVLRASPHAEPVRPGSESALPMEAAGIRGAKTDKDGRIIIAPGERL